MYDMNRIVTYSQVGRDLTMDMVGVVHFLQDCTLEHSESIGRGLDHVAATRKAWFLSSWQIEVCRFPKYQEHITVRTWPHEFKGMYGYRNFDILDSMGKQIVLANSIWIFMDLSRMSPMKPSEEDMRGYDIEPAIDMKYAPRKIKQLSREYALYETVSCDEKDNFKGITVKKSFLDSNNHVNNGRYVSEALDLIEMDCVKKMRVDYRKAAVLGDVMYPVVLKKDEITQVVLNDPEGNPYVLVEFTE